MRDRLTKTAVAILSKVPRELKGWLTSRTQVEQVGTPTHRYVYEDRKRWALDPDRLPSGGLGDGSMPVPIDRAVSAPVPEKPSPRRLNPIPPRGIVLEWLLH